MRLVLFLLALSAFAADTVLYVNTASTAGGTCTTNATEGADRACATLSDAEALLPADITTGGTQGNATIWCEGSAADTSSVTFAGTTTSATYQIYVKTTAGNRHDGRWNTGKYRIEAGYDYAVLVQENYVNIEGLQIKNIGRNGTPGNGIRVQAVGARLSHNVIWGPSTYNDTAGLKFGGISMSVVSSTPNYAWNNIIYDYGTSGTTTSTFSGIYTGYGVNYVYNNTIIGCKAHGIRHEYGTAHIKNNLASGNGTADYDGTFSTATTNLSSDTSSPNSDLRSKTVTFVDAAGKDFHLDAADASAKGAGTDLSGDAALPISTDIDGVTRSAPWDIGADETAAASGGRKRVQVIQ